MKARVKATGEIVELLQDGDMYYCTDKVKWFHTWELDFIDDTDEEDTPDYWTRLEHTYAGMAMQEILRGCGDYYELKKLAPQAHEYRAESIAEISKIYAHALVEKMKEERK